MQGQSGGFHGSSPILLLKNFNQDRGLRLFETCFGKDGQDYVNGSAPMTAWMHQFMPGSAAAVRRQAEAVQRAASRALDICEHAVRQQGDKGQRAERALKQRSPWQLTLPREYNKGRNELPHHVDGTGSWVVLFSFGLTVDFYVGHKTVCVESGDALIFNGSPSHGVVHGFTNPVRRNATYRGKSQPLVGMRIVDDKRMSVQARMS